MTNPICPICGEEMKPWLFVPGDYQQPYMKETYQLYWCEKSKLGCQYPIPSSEKIRSFYEHEDYYTHRPASKGLPVSLSKSFWEQLLTNIAWRFDLGQNMSKDWFVQNFGSTPRSICEIGCGNGKLLQQLQNLGNNVCGVEPDPKARSIAVNDRNLPVFDGTAEYLPYEIQSRSYEIVILSHVLEHVVDPLLCLQKVKDLLVPQGKLVIETPNNSALSLTKSGITWFCLRVPRHLYFFTKDSLHSFCDKADLKVITTEFSNYTRQFRNEYILYEQKNWDFFYSQGYTKLPSKNSSLKAWLLLIQTIFAEDERKYDCIRVIVEKKAMT